MSVSGPRRRASGSIVANPVLIGAVTTLVVLIAVFLAYNANNGLPFVPTTQVKVLIPNASEVVKGDQVRSGGFLVGLVKDLKPVTLPDGRTVAQMTLALNKTIGRIPADSTVTIRPKSVLGLKYVQVTKGFSQRDLKDGDTIPVKQTSTPVELDQVLSTFDKPTRSNSRANLTYFGNAFAGRGPALNQTINNLPELLRLLTPVTANLANPRTDLAGFFGSLDRAARIVAPVAPSFARGFTYMATTFDAISRSPQALRDTIAKSPATLDVATRSLHDQRPFLRDFAALSSDERYAARQLVLSLPKIDPALETGTRILPTTPPLNGRLRGVFAAVRDLANAPTTNQGIRALTDTVTTLQPQLRYLGPYVTVCNYWNQFWTLLAEHMTGYDPQGSSERILTKFTSNPNSQNDPGSEGATFPANGSTPGVYFHGQGFGSAVNSRGFADCESGQRGYPAGRLSHFTGSNLNIVSDPHDPGLSGPTFKSFSDNTKPLRSRALGPNRVPRGETFDPTPRYPGAGLPQVLQQRQP